MRVALAILVTAALVVLSLEVQFLRQEWPPVALCPNHEGVVVHGTPWEMEHGRKPRTIKAPACEEGVF